MDADKVYTKHIYTAGMAALAVCLCIAALSAVFSRETVTVRDVLLPVFFVACCVFMTYFYIDCKRALFKTQKIALHITAVCLMVSFAGICIEGMPAYLPLYVLAVVFLAGVSDMGLALLVLSSCLLYGLIFRGISLNDHAVSFLLAAIICVLISNTTKLVSMLIACQITITLHIVIVLLKNNFAFSSIASLNFLFSLLYYVVVIVIVWYARGVFGRLGLRSIAPEEPSVLSVSNLSASANDVKTSKPSKDAESKPAKSSKTNKETKETELKLKKAEKALEEKENRIKKVEKSLEDKDQRLKKAEKSLEEKDRSLKESERSLEEKDRKLKNTESSLADSKLKLSETEKSLKESETRLSEVEKSLAESEMLLGEARKDIEDRDLRIKEFESSQGEESTKLESTDRLVKLETERADMAEKEKERLEEKLKELEEMVTYLDSNRVFRVSDVIDPEFEYCRELSDNNPSLYKHCVQIGNCAAKACDLIGADPMLGYAIGLYHEAAKALGTTDVEGGLARFKLPENVLAGAMAVKTMPDKPILRETGIVILSDEIRNAVMYAKSKNLEVTPDKIISNVLKAKKEQGLLKNAGFSVEEIQLMRMFFAEMFA